MTVIDHTEELERDVLRMLLAGEDLVLQTLRTQLQFIAKKTRDWTGCGYYTDFVLSPDAPFLYRRASFQFGDVVARFEGSPAMGGFLLYVRAGILSTLEAYTFGEDQWNKNTPEYHLSYDREPRDWQRLRATQGWPG